MPGCTASPSPLPSVAPPVRPPLRSFADRVRQVVKERGYIAPVLLDESGDVTGRVYGVWGPPTIYLVDRAGRLVGRAIGRRDWSTPAARTFIRELLAAS